MRLLANCFFIFLTAPLILDAQARASKKASPVSVVTGHVFCADTNGPARQATVVLEPAGALDNQQPEKPDADSASMPAVHMTSVQTLPDGSFVLKGVTPGAYYVVASIPGYVSSLAALGFSEDDFKSLDDNDKKLVRKSLPRVVVEANLPASIDVTLERGAAVSGTVLYDDGSPAAGISLIALIRNPNATQDSKQEPWVGQAHNPAGGGETGTSTDDRGNFRMSALPAHEYVLKATLEISRSDYMIKSGGMSSYSTGLDSMPVYSGSKTRLKDAVPFKIKLGEELTGEDITIPLGKLRKVNGTITAARDGHVVNGGSVALLHADDKTEVAKTELQQDDTTFTFNFVPDGDYILHATDAADVDYVEADAKDDMAPPRFDAHKEHTYDAADQAIHVDADLNGVAIAVPEKSTAAPAASSAPRP